MSSAEDLDGLVRLVCVRRLAISPSAAALDPLRALKTIRRSVRRSSNPVLARRRSRRDDDREWMAAAPSSLRYPCLYPRSPRAASRATRNAKSRGRTWREPETSPLREPLRRRPNCGSLGGLAATSGYVGQPGAETNLPWCRIPDGAGSGCQDPAPTTRRAGCLTLLALKLANARSGPDHTVRCTGGSTSARQPASLDPEVASVHGWLPLGPFNGACESGEHCRFAISQRVARSLRLLCSRPSDQRHNLTWSDTRTSGDVMTYPDRLTNLAQVRRGELRARAGA